MTFVQWVRSFFPAWESYSPVCQRQKRARVRRRTGTERLEGRCLLTPLPVLEGFEAASLNDLTDWSFPVSAAGTVALSTSTARSGSQSLNFDVSSNTASMSDAVVKLDLTGAVGATDLALEFHAQRQASSSVDNNLQIDVSPDGVTWSPVAADIQGNLWTWIPYAFDLDVALNASSIAFDSDVFVRFRHLGNATSHQMLIDDVRIARFDPFGPTVSGISSSGLTSVPVSTIDVTFSEPMDVATLTPANISVRDPAGAVLALAGNAVDSGDQTTFTLTLAEPQSALGTYRVIVFERVTDVAGNRLNQDEDTSNGESQEDVFHGDFQAGPPVAQTVPLFEGFETASFAELPGWSFEVTTGGTMFLTTSHNPPEGTRQLKLDQTANNLDMVKTATLLLDLSSQSGATDLALDFFASRGSTSPANLLSVQASGDGTIFHQLGAVITPNLSTQSNYFLDLDQELAAAGIDLDSDVYLQFRHDGRQTSDEVTIDAVRISNRETVGPKVVTFSPTGMQGGPVSQFQITFNEVLDLAEFTASDVVVQNPAGAIIPLATNPVDTGDQKTFELNLATSQSLVGEYRISIGPDVRDLAGNLMNQDQDIANAEAVDDVFTATLQIGPAVAQTVPYLQDFEVSALESLAGWSFATSSDSGLVSLTTDSFPYSGTRHLQFTQSGSATEDAILLLDLRNQVSATDLALDFRRQSRVTSGSANALTVSVSGDGVTWTQMGGSLYGNVDDYVNPFYDLDQELAAAGIALDQDIYIRFRHNGNSAPYFMLLDDIRITNRDAAGSRITSSTPTGTIAAPITQLEVTFDEPIDVATFTSADVTITGPVGDIPVSTDPVDSGDQRTFTILLDEASSVPGFYQVRIGRDVRDLAGNPMNQDGDNTNDEADSDVFADTLRIDSAPISQLTYEQSFDSAAGLGSHWFFESTGKGRIELVDDGDRSVLRMDTTSGPQSATNIATLSIDLAGRSGVHLTFEEYNPADEVSVSDGVYISDDLGATWFKAAALASPSSIWQFHDIDLDAALTAAGMTYTSDFQVRIQQQGFYPWTSDGRQFDNLSVHRGTLTLEIDTPTTTEGIAVSPVLKVSRDPVTDIAQPITVTLSSSDVTAVTVQSSVEIPANTLFVEIPLNVQDDLAADGPQLSTITATASEFGTAKTTLEVLDNEPATLHVTVDNAVVNEATGPGAATATVTRNRDFAEALVVDLISNDESAIVVQQSVTIPAGKASITFDLATHNDFEVDATQTATITATGVGHVDGTVQIQVENDDTVAHRTIGGWFSGTLPEDDYLVTFDVKVKSGDTWTIEPSTQLKFMSGTELSLGGTLLADAEVGSEIIFTSAAVTPAPGDWSGIVVSSSGGQRTILDHVDISYATTGLRFQSADSPQVTLSQSEIRMSRDSGVHVAADYVHISRTDVTISGNRIHDNGGNGISVSASAVSGASAGSSPTIIGNNVYQNGLTGLRVSAAHGSRFGLWPFFGTSASPFVKDNVISANGTGGIHISAYDAPDNVGSGATSGIYQNNLVVANSGFGVYVTTSGDGSAYPTMINNTIATNSEAGIFQYPFRSSGTILQNNIVAFNGSGIESSTTFNPVDGNVANNNVFGNINGDWSAWFPSAYGQLTEQNSNGTPVDVYGNISSDPLFVSPTDFHLQPASPAINAGTPDAALVAVDDFDGDLRVDAPDIGYDEVIALSFSIADDFIIESDGVGAATATIGRGNIPDTVSAIMVTLSVDDDTEISVPLTVQIPANESSVTFLIDAVDDALLDGIRTARITVTSAGLPDIHDTIDIHDDESLTLTFLPTTIFENSGTAATIGRVSRSNTGDTSAAIDVTLTNDDDSEILVPATITIPIGATFVDFNVDAIDDVLLDGIQTVTVTASSAGYTAATQTLDVHDHEPLSLVIASASISESDGPAATTATVTLPGPNIGIPAPYTATATDVPITVPNNQTRTSEIVIDQPDSTVLDVDVMLDITHLETNQLHVFLISPAGTRVELFTAVGGASDHFTQTILDDEATEPIANGTGPFTGRYQPEGLLSAVDGEDVSGTWQLEIRDTLTYYAPILNSWSLDFKVSVLKPVDVHLAATPGNELSLPATVQVPRNASQVTFNIGPVDDLRLDGTTSVDVTASASGYLSIVDSLQVTDNDVAGFSYSVTDSNTTVSEAGTTDTFSVKLDVQPLSNVRVNITPEDPSEVSVNKSFLTFTPANWNAFQVVTVTGLNDVFVDGHQTTNVRLSIDDASSLDEFDPLPDQLVSVTTQDDDLPGFTVTATGGSTVVNEPGSMTDTFDVVLDSGPTSDVVLLIINPDTGEVTTSVTELRFTPANWNQAQTVTVTGVDEPTVDGDQTTTLEVVVDQQNSDNAFDNVATRTLAVRTTDDDSAGFRFGETGLSTVVDEAGTTDRFDVWLTAQPLTDVVVRVVSLDTGEVTVDKTQLIFTFANWDQHQSVLVRGEDDNLVDGNVSSVVSLSILDESSDDAFDPLPDQSVSVVTTDNDTASFTVTQTMESTIVGEDGSTDQISVVLDRAPLTDVVILVGSNNIDEAIVAPSALTFTPLNWNIARQVTVMGVDDAVVDGNAALALTVRVDALNSNPAFTGLANQTINVTNVDNDSVGVTVSAISGDTTESGGTATFTVVLNSEPTADVSIGLSSSDTTEGTVTTPPLTFTPLNWNQAQTVTVSGQNDDVDDGDITYSIQVQPAVSSDPLYNGFDATDVLITNVDNDPGVTVSAISGDTTESGGTATFTVVLNSRTTADVSIGLSSSDTTEGTVSPPLHVYAAELEPRPRPSR
ncbi:MAG: Ig-like domain-containing protein [Planctomycetaceae bacterium]